MALTKVSYSMIKGSPINVLDYGAVGDGVADDTTAIQNALTAISATRPALYFPAGTYKITAGLNVTANGSGYGGLIYGDGYASNIVYYPPPNAAAPWGNTADGYGPFNAGAFNFGNDNYQGFGFVDLRITLGGGTKNGACGLKAYKWYQGYIRNVNISGFEAAIHISFGWSSVIEQCKIYNSTYGIAWDNITIGTVRANDIATCNIGLYYGWNIFGDNVVEVNLFAQGVTISENTIQGCQEAAIVGKNQQNVNIFGTYTEGNCAGPYPTLQSANVVGAATYNSCEFIFFSTNVYGNSNIVIRNNWLTSHQGIYVYALGLGQCYGFTWQNNNAYTVPYIQGETKVSCIFEGYLGKVVTDVTLDNSQSAGTIQTSFQSSFKQTLPYTALASLTGTETFAIAANTTQSFCFPISIADSLAYNNAQITAPSLPAGLTFSVGVYVNYINGIVVLATTQNATPTYIAGATTINLALASTIILPEGDVYMIIQVSNTTGSPVNFVYNSLTGFASNRNDTMGFRVASVAPNSLAIAGISQYINPAQIALSN
jgi:hypothetical protein